jgi:inner membrane protein
VDSVSQFVLGASVAAAALGAHARPWRAVLWGGAVATLPDLDVLIDHGSAVANMLNHRADSHSLLWLTVVSPLLAFAIAAFERERHRFRRWWAAVWLALVTHPLLDAMTIYGTKLALPFSDHGFAVGSLFVIDPLYTLPLLVGLVGYVARGALVGRGWNRGGLLLSCAYVGWSVFAQGVATGVAEKALAAQGLAPRALVVTAAPLQTVLWRVLAVDDDAAYEGFWSFFDGDRPLQLQRIARGVEWLPAVRVIPAAAALDRFAGGCTKVERHGDKLRLVDLRMGQEPHYVFGFDVARIGGDGALVPNDVDRKDGARIDAGKGMAWLWPRMWGANIPSPR